MYKKTTGEFIESKDKKQKVIVYEKLPEEMVWDPCYLNNQLSK